MIGDDSTVWRSPGSPTSTGQVPTFSQRSASARSAAGGSVSETKLAALDRAGPCASSRTSAAAPPRGRLRERRRVRDPHGDAEQTAPERLGGDLDAARERAASCASAMPAGAPAVVQVLALLAGRDRGSRRARARRSAALPRTSRSVASSQATYRSPSTASSSTGSSPSRSAARPCARPRAGSARARRGARPAPPSTRHSVCITHAVVGMRGAVCARIDAAERPAPLVLERRAPVGPQHVALVEHRVGDPPHAGPRYSAFLARAARRASCSQLGSACRAR